MAAELEKSAPNRLEDFIALAKEGKDVQVSVALRKQIVTQKVHPDQTEEMRGELDMYLLVGDYSFKVGGEVRKVSKIYVSGTVEEPLNASRTSIYIANARLNMDYARLREADIIFDEKYWEERS